MFKKIRIAVLLTTMIVLLLSTTAVFAAPLQGSWIKCPNGGASCTGCIYGGDEPNNYYCNSNGWIVNYTSSCVQQGSPLYCNYDPICHCMPYGQSDHCCSSWGDC